MNFNKITQRSQEKWCDSTSPNVHSSTKTFYQCDSLEKERPRQKMCLCQGQGFQCQCRARRKTIKNIQGKKKRSNYLQNPLQLFQIKLEEQNYFLLLASFLPGIPGNIFAAVSHSFCVWTLVCISEHSNSRLQVRSSCGSKGYASCILEKMFYF